MFELVVSSGYVSLERDGNRLLRSQEPENLRYDRETFEFKPIDPELNGRVTLELRAPVDVVGVLRLDYDAEDGGTWGLSWDDGLSERDTRKFFTPAG